MHDDPNSDSCADDTAAEARIVAWVLGEASAFEAAELERLVAARPALALFKRRIEAVHGLLGEAARVRASDTLQLAPERRKTLQAALGVSASTVAEPAPAVVEAPPSRRHRRLSAEWKALRLYFGTAAACVFVFFVVSQFQTTFSSRAARDASVQLSPERLKEIRAEAAFEVWKEGNERMADEKAAVDWAEVSLPMSADMAFSSAGAVTVPVQRNIGTGRSAPLFMLANLDTPSREEMESGEPETVPAGDDGQRIVLSEFTVTADVSDSGYTASETLAGSRMNTTLRDVGSAVSVGNVALLRDSGQGSSLRGQSSYKASGGDSGFRQEGAPRDASVAWSAGFTDGAPAFAADATIQVVTPQYLQDTGATDNSTLLQYTANTETAGFSGNFSGRTGGEPPNSTVFGFASPAESSSDLVRGVPTPAQPRFLAASNAGAPQAARKAEREASEPLRKGAPKPATAEPPAQPAAPLAVMSKDKTAAEADAKLQRASVPAAVPVAIDEAHAAREPVSTFSLHVGDTSFKLAQAALARGQLPEPAQIRPEEFYNAFDYGDVSPTLDQKVACRIEQAAHPFLQQRNLVRVAMKVANTGRGAGQPLRLTVLLDTSGSMEREDRAASVRRAMEVLASLLGPNDRVTLIGFARQPRLLAEAVRGDEAARLVDLVRRTPAEGGTNIEEALKLADQLAQRHFEAAAQNRIVLLTDGAANLGDADPARLTERIEALRGRGIAFDACGVGTDGLDDEILEALTRRGDGRYSVIDSPEQADSGFARQLAGAFRPAAKNVKVQVRFNPARVGAYRLLGFEKHRLREEDFRNDRVDAAELAAEEAAVAVYQVEVLSQGEGDLGDVFVRFRDVATGQMVERSWTIGYDNRVRAFDQASPSLRLAGVAALVAEVLRGGALGDQVDLDALAPVVSSLKTHYTTQPRVQELAVMYEQLRRRIGR